MTRRRRSWAATRTGRSMQAAAEALAEFDVPYEVRVVSAHRTPDAMLDYGRDGRGPRAAGHHRRRGRRRAPARHGRRLTPLPVIGVPVPLKYLDGMDSLLSIVQMPAGIPVATVSIGGAATPGCSRCGSWPPPILPCSSGWSLIRLLWFLLSRLRMLVFGGPCRSGVLS